jgi:hypothetical protein
MEKGALVNASLSYPSPHLDILVQLRISSPFQSDVFPKEAVASIWGVASIGF